MTAPTAEAASAPGDEEVPASTNGQGTEAPAAEEAAVEEKPKRATRTKSTAKKTRTVELTLTVTGSLDGAWQADLMHGTTRVVQGLTIPAAAVAKAAQELHPEIAEKIDEVITAAREQHESRLRELEAEMAKVKQALADLGEDA
ncbi:DUF6319 domain-containing protein [Kibdelosporangium persicum]|uniref:Mucin-associated surface protein (MASP) n=1 Tax=Kibdelosporangium persicum TaxID=2698649 RepID=A0ABX2EVD7_9PSEU|nr:DUF6319 family protein [Kibdelosporangium persicum]NRN62995.1 Mucin-associated surface protein (MASP) [Kibdelosporangium persicum]